MRRPTWIKICGVTLPEDLETLIAARVDAVGLNFIARSKRRVDVSVAKSLAQVAKGRIEVIGVVEDLEEASILELVDAVGLDRVQLHGNESATLLDRLGGIAYKAIGIATAEDVSVAVATVGERLLVDTKSGVLVGGTGVSFDWRLVEGLCRTRNVILAGGLNADNVAAAVELLHPFGVDVASGVEAPERPGIKVDALVRRFVDAIRSAER